MTQSVAFAAVLPTIRRAKQCEESRVPKYIIRQQLHLPRDRRAPGKFTPTLSGFMTFNSFVNDRREKRNSALKKLSIRGRLITPRVSAAVNLKGGITQAHYNVGARLSAAHIINNLIPS
jgi:hypothetical protein